MGSAVAWSVRSWNAVEPDLSELPEPATAREVDVDDVRALLTELRLRRQLRAGD